MSGTNAQKFAMVFGAVYVVVGILGFIPAVGGSTTQDGDLLLGVFGINLVHNLVHLAVGVLLLAGGRSASGAASVNTLVGAVYLVVGVLGFTAILDDLLNINMADNVLHLATGVLALYFGLAGRGAAPATT